jgi:hypothetical protein
MSFVGEATGVFGLLDKAWNLLRDRLDPARALAQRLIETFEGYGIARRQIPRLPPPELKYEEICGGLDGTEPSRYWLLLDGWHRDHSPCVSKKVPAIAVAQSLGVMVIDHDLPPTLLRQLGAEMKLAPVMATQLQRVCHPDDLITPLPRTVTPWRQAIWLNAKDRLGQDWLNALANGIADQSNRSMGAPAVSQVMPS